uniref:dicarboxylate/amino acid:cation symporter n=1 Tax=Alistipes sp. TaxID=1872444 RepID=UPI004056C0B1
MKKLLKNLGVWILIAMLLGILVGVLMGPSAAMFAPLGSLFIQLIKMLVIPLVAISIISGAATLGDSKSAGKIGLISIGYILLTTLVAVLLAIGAGELFRPGEGLDAGRLAGLISTSSDAGTAPTLSFWETIIGMIPENPIRALTDGNILQIIVFGLFLGFGISTLQTEKRLGVVNGLNHILEALIWCIEKVMLVAPLGVFGLMADATGTFGFEILLQIANLLWVDLLAVLVMGLGVYPLTLVLFSRVKLREFFRAMLKPQLIAFSTASSMATLPVNMEVCENELKLSKQTTGFVLPLGATINMAGNAIYYTLVALFFAQLYGIELTMAQYITITIVSTLGSIGQAGVPGPTLMVVAVLVGAGIPIEGLPLLYALDRIFDMVRTTLNITGDAACAAVTDHYAR